MVTEIRQGDVFWVDFGSPTGSGPAERHPAVVVQRDAFNASAIATTVVCLITSNMRLPLAPGNVALKKGDAGLPKSSVVNVSQVFTVHEFELGERVGRLPFGALAAVLAGLRLLLLSEPGELL
jgi:mRNA interferase MazF